jgi:hypothetical protein
MEWLEEFGIRLRRRERSNPREGRCQIQYRRPDNWLQDGRTCGDTARNGASGCFGVDRSLEKIELRRRHRCETGFEFPGDRCDDERVSKVAIFGIHRQDVAGIFILEPVSVECGDPLEVVDRVVHGVVATPGSDASVRSLHRATAEYYEVRRGQRSHEVLGEGSVRRKCSVIDIPGRMKMLGENVDVLRERSIENNRAPACRNLLDLDCLVTEERQLCLKGPARRIRLEVCQIACARGAFR